MSALHQTLTVKAYSEMMQLLRIFAHFLSLSTNTESRWKLEAKLLFQNCPRIAYFHRSYHFSCAVNLLREWYSCFYLATHGFCSESQNSEPRRIQEFWISVWCHWTWLLLAANSLNVYANISLNHRFIFKNYSCGVKYKKNWASLNTSQSCLRIEKAENEKCLTDVWQDHRQVCKWVFSS